MAVLLDFEKPLEELLEQLEKAQATHDKGNVDMSDTVAQLTKKINNEKKELYKNLTGWQKVQISRHPDRPYTLDYIAAIAKNFIELHGDRNVGDDKAMVGGLAQIDNQNVMIIGQQKGRTTKERQYRNFGMPNPEGYRKALRLMRMAEKFNMPVICLIDTPGAFPGLEAEERGQGEAIAKNLMVMATLKVPIICVVIGEGASGGEPNPLLHPDHEPAAQAEPDNEGRNEGRKCSVCRGASVPTPMRGLLSRVLPAALHVRACTLSHFQ